MRVRNWAFILSMFLLLGACSNNEEELISESKDSSAKSEMDSSLSGDQATESETENAESDKAAVTSDRMVIHQAQLQLKVKSIEKTHIKIERKAKEYGGYVVESTVNREDEELLEGTITVRVPEEYFQDFLEDTEGEATKVVQRSVSGEDVTEQYVDVKARLKSKRVVEERLLTFMKEAKKTEDLLEISSDLAVVQEEIEQLVGQIKYLENQTSYSTVTIGLSQNTIIVPSIENKELNTWERTKKQFITSANMLLQAGAGLVVLVVGNMPVIIIVCVLVAVIYWVLKRREK